MPPEISVIIPAHDAAATLGRALAALDRQRGAPAFELIVVDDGSRDDTADIARTHGARVVRHEQARGSAAARNSGVAAASAPLLAFTDADCEPAPGWLAEGAAALERVDLVQGRVLPEAGVEARTFDKTIWIERETGLYETANLLVRREWFERAGGFRSFVAGDLRTPGLRPSLGEADVGEDTMFAWRARRAGARTEFVAGALVHHAVFPRNAAGFVRERWRLRYFPTLVREVPELREVMFLRIFQTRRRAAFDAAAAAVLVALVTRRPAALLGVVPYVAGHLPVRRFPRPGPVREAAALLAADAVGGAALVYGSVAARRVLL